MTHLLSTLAADPDARAWALLAAAGAYYLLALAEVVWLAGEAAGAIRVVRWSRRGCAVVAVLLLGLVLAGCSGGAAVARADLPIAASPPAALPYAAPVPSEGYWCFPAVAATNGERMVGCFKEEASCDRVRGMALDHGRLAKIAEVGDCDYTELY